MSRMRLPREIEKLKQRILVLGAAVEKAVHLAVRSVSARQLATAQMVCDGDAEVDLLEVDLEEECLKLLALYQPVAVDLRFIVAVLKINNDLERIGDLAENVADRARLLCTLPEIAIPYDFDHMSELTKGMIRGSLDALVKLDADLAFRVINADDEVDAINHEMYFKIAEAMRHRPEEIERLMLFLGVSRLLERMADHATNIAEDVVYLVTGQIVRHRLEDVKGILERLESKVP